MSQNFIGALALFGTMTLATIAAADEGESARLKAAGDVLFDQARYAEAYEHYARAYAAHPSPALLYNEGRALEAMGEYPEALDKLDEFSKRAPADVLARVPKLGELTTDLRGRITTLHVTANVPDARLFVRGKDLGAVGADRTVRVRAGQATIRVVAEAHQPFERGFALAGGARVEVDAKLERATSSGGTIASKWWFWTAIGVVVVGGATTAFVLTREQSADTGTFSPSQVRVSGFAW